MTICEKFAKIGLSTTRGCGFNPDFCYAPQIFCPTHKTYGQSPKDITTPKGRGFLSYTKTGSFPVYLTSYQKYWEKAPKKNKSDFEITTHFGDNSSSILKAGEEVTLTAEVKVKHDDARYVMINIPIPGGCSYADKRNYFKNESHREYFKNKTAIFCEYLPEGEYSFEVKLIPRYTGNYTLNPAKVELMYFPVFSGNNEVQKVRIWK